MSSGKRSFASYLLIILSAEKLVQHTVVSLSLFYDLGGVRSTLAIDYRVLLVSGIVVAVLFAVASFLLAWRNRWGPRLTAVLAVFDIVGEFVAQGTVLVLVNVSMVVAVALLVLCYLEVRGASRREPPRMGS